MAGFLTTLTLLVCMCCVTLAEPEICADYQCAEYTQERIDGKNFVRTYPSEITWASTSKMGSSRGMFMKLFYYIGGENSAEQKIDMTVPVPKKIETLSNGDKRYTMSFYLAVPNPPTPTNPDVTLVTQPANTQYYVREFKTWGWGGVFTRSQWNTALNKLKESLNREGKAFNPDVMYEVGYSPPWYWTKTCEIWLVPQQ